RSVEIGCLAGTKDTATEEGRGDVEAVTSLCRAIQSTRLGWTPRTDYRRRSAARRGQIRRPIGRIALLRELRTPDSAMATGSCRSGRGAGSPRAPPQQGRVEPGFRCST